MIINFEMLTKFNVCQDEKDAFVEAFPDGLDVSGLWGTADQRAATWLRLLQSEVVKRNLGWVIGEGLVPARITANLSGANLTGANLRGADLTGANLRGADLTGANLSGANLTGTNLITANLSGANLTGANLRGANLTGADLYEANLNGANLTWADLYEANLNGANLNGAYLRGANLTGADLYGAYSNKYTRWPDGFSPKRTADHGVSSTDIPDDANVPF